MNFSSRAGIVFSPFVSPLEGVSMMSMMGCSMSAASQAASLIPAGKTNLWKQGFKDLLMRLFRAPGKYQ